MTLHSDFLIDFIILKHKLLSKIKNFKISSSLRLLLINLLEQKETEFNFFQIMFLFNIIIQNFNFFIILTIN